MKSISCPDFFSHRNPLPFPLITIYICNAFSFIYSSGWFFLWFGIFVSFSALSIRVIRTKCARYVCVVDCDRLSRNSHKLLISWCVSCGGFANVSDRMLLKCRWSITDQHKSHSLPANFLRIKANRQILISHMEMGHTAFASDYIFQMDIRDRQQKRERVCARAYARRHQIIYNLQIEWQHKMRKAMHTMHWEQRTARARTYFHFI